MSPYTDVSLYGRKISSQSNCKSGQTLQNRSVLLQTSFQNIKNMQNTSTLMIQNNFKSAVNSYTGMSDVGKMPSIHRTFGFCQFTWFALRCFRWHPTPFWTFEQRVSNAKVLICYLNNLACTMSAYKYTPHSKEAK